MLEAVAVYTPLTIVWDIRTEWASRGTGIPERFYEGTSRTVGDDHVIKVVAPGVILPPPSRAILMVRDPDQIAVSCRKVGLDVTATDAAARQRLFRERWTVDEVHVDELADLDTVFARLADAGWPVHSPSFQMNTRSAR